MGRAVRAPLGANRASACCVLLDQAGRDPSTYPISKRVFMSVHERPEVARAEVERWFGEVYHNRVPAAEAGVFGTPAQVREQLEAMVANLGVNHLLLNPVARYTEQVEMLAEVAWPELLAQPRTA